MSDIIILRTLKEWNDLEYKVKKGSKSSFRNSKNEALFRKNQVTKINLKNYKSSQKSGYSSYKMTPYEEYHLDYGAYEMYY